MAGGITNEEATQQVISNTFFSLGIDSISGGLPVFVNFPRPLLLDATAILLPNQTTIVEILEDVAIDAEVLQACKDLKTRGYRLAIDDFCGEAGRESIIDIADYLKVDFRQTDLAARNAIRSRFRRPDLQFLAEKVETNAEFSEAVELGYALFQGYFFARPQVLKGSEVPTLKANAMRILGEIHQEEPNLVAVAQLVRNDISLCRRLLRYMNSAAFAWHSPVVSVERALGNLGEIGARRWLSMAVLPELSSGNADALTLAALTRAKFCEQAAARLGLSDHDDSYFLMGLFSMLDAMLGRPLAEALEEVPLAAEAKATLLGSASSTKTESLWQLALACEAADAESAAEICKSTSLRAELSAQMWTNALSWSNGICSDFLPD